MHWLCNLYTVVVTYTVMSQQVLGRLGSEVNQWRPIHGVESQDTEFTIIYFYYKVL